LTESSLTETILITLGLAALYPLLVAYITYFYRGYIMSGKSQYKKPLLIITILIPLCIPTLFIYLAYLTRSFLILIPVLLALLVSLVAVFGYRVRVMEQTVCKEEEKRDFGGVECFLCSTRVISVWSRGEKVYISKLLAERLSIDELKIIVRREAAREKEKYGKWLSRISTYSYWMWSFTLACVLIILQFVNRVPLSLPELLLSIIILYWIASIYTLSAVVSSWLLEHELDKNVMRNTDLCIAIAALVKTETYVKLASEGLLEAIDELRVRSITNMRNLRFSTLFYTLLIHSLLYPKRMIDYVLNPIYPSRPPLWLRVAVLLHSQSQQPR